MLVPYRRHNSDCPHASDGRRWNRCKCPIWVQGTLDGEPIREALETRIWTEANDTIQKWIAAGGREEPEQEQAPELVPDQTVGLTISEACASFTAEMQALKLRDSSQKKYRIMFRQLETYCSRAGVRLISEIELEHTTKFRQTWNGCTSGSAGKRLERLRTFQAFLVKHKWIPENYAKMLRRPKDTARPTLPYTLDEMKRLLNACTTLIAERPRIGKAKMQRLRALILLDRYSGLRIGDAASLPIDRLEGQKLFLYTAKTGTPVYTKLPQFVVDELDRCPRLSPGYWFWTGCGSKESLSENYRRVFREVAKLAKVKNAHPHRFRDTFAVELLLNGVPIEQVSMLLGHSSIKVTEKHYAPWVRARQRQLEESLDRAIKDDPLAREESSRTQKLVRIK
jgi:integrase/recombinase XerD